ncbi:hypothetical protein [Silvibacterium dinghuense]|uniref:DUF2846 domain-containing protein n=1 Tax=Silvibacterium dinghuense TaxID=1560006 RepID=A0A4Q1SJ31_9BACT|nr:hypothetical protein [Silvibacterium dinghuense]RXS97427.1 hypothetical protein ESZ00_05890 [Silvibacterium dinghuense]GGG98924.1 hypothetical protein GCM10011586_13010 [Silvibacterium dinghuense]
MKKFAIAAFALAAGLFATSRLHAQSTELRVTIPFHFIVSGKTLPAGTYRFYSVHSDTVIIQNIDGSAGALSHIAATEEPQPALQSILFDKYGDRYFLREIDSSTALLNGQLPVSKAEKQTQRMEASLPAEHVALALGE